MQGIRIGVGITWGIFWVGWLISAFTAKRSVGQLRSSQGRVVIAVAAVVIFRLIRPHGLVVQSVPIGILGALILLAGLSLAAWARVYLGRNWGMPMTTKEEPELVTSGPYSYVRHPIYTGIMVGVLGTAITINLLGIVVFFITVAVFYYSARVEEQNMTAAFPEAYPAYREHTKMLIPFVL